MRDGDGSPTAARSRIPGFVWWSTLALLGLMVLYGILVPVYQAPDEPQHVDAVLLAMSSQGWPLGVGLHAGVVASREAAGFGRLPLAAADATPRGERPAPGAAGGRRISDEINQMTQHPPLYYLLLAGVLGTVGPDPSGSGYDRVAGALRLWNVALLLPLPLLAYLASRRVSARLEAQVAATLVPLAIPQFVHISSSVNNDNLLVLLLALLTWLLLVAVDEPGKASVSVAAGLVAGAALLTKGFALVTPVGIAVAYACAWWANRRSAVVHGTLALAIALAVGGWWWVRNLVQHGALQPYGAPLPDYRAEGFTPLLADWLPHFVSRMALRFWGSLGWFSVHLPWWLVWLATAVAVVAAGVAVAGAVRRRQPRPRHLVVLLFPLLALLGGTASASWGRYAARASVGGIHGRYLFGGLVGLAVVVGLGLALALRRRLAAPATIAILGLVLHAFAAHRSLDHYWAAGSDAGWSGQVRSLLAWSPWPPTAAVIACGVIGSACVGLVASVVMAYRGARNQP